MRRDQGTLRSAIIPVDLNYFCWRADRQSTTFPLIDGWLIAVDGMSGFDWLSLNEALRPHESVFENEETVYLSLRWHMIALNIGLFFRQ